MWLAAPSISMFFNGAHSEYSTPVSFEQYGEQPIQLGAVVEWLMHLSSLYGTFLIFVG